MAALTSFGVMVNMVMEVSKSDQGTNPKNHDRKAIVVLLG